MTKVPAEAVLPEAVADLVASLRRAIRKAARVRTPAMPLSVAQLELLSLVQEHPGARPGDLAGLLRLAANSVSTLDNAMVSAGMLERSPGATDKRTVAFRLTPQGAQLVGQWRTTNAALLQSAIAALNSQDRQILAEALPVLKRLVAVIDEQADRPTHTPAEDTP
ncbi:MAG: MarR family winged helix-turn-helix transcriptional regulator [Dermatophilaceae bacterium]